MGWAEGNRRRALFWVGLLLLGGFLILALPTPSARGGEVLLNGGFEEGTGGLPLYWQALNLELTWSQSPVHGGIRSAGLSSAVMGTGYAYQAVPVEAGASYTLTGYVQVEDAGPGSTYLRLTWHSLPGGFGAELGRVDSSMQMGPVSQFVLLSTGEVPAPLGAQSAKVRLVIHSLEDTPFRAFYDDISLWREEPPPSNTPTPTPTATPIPRAPWLLHLPYVHRLAS